MSATDMEIIPTQLRKSCPLPPMSVPIPSTSHHFVPHHHPIPRSFLHCHPRPHPIPVRQLRGFG